MGTRDSKRAAGRKPGEKGTRRPPSKAAREGSGVDAGADEDATPATPEREDAPQAPPARVAVGAPARGTKTRPGRSEPAVEAERTGRRFPIVGIGASAGGLEALEQFLRNVPERCGAAFVIVQHQDPTHRGAMVELLQRASAMKVAEVTDGQRVEPDRVYVIPPSKDLAILHGVLHLLPQTAPRGLNLPIDSFFRSLAEDQQERSIGVVLSGMGSDGTLGLRAIKEKAGATFVQALSSAKFEGMPRSAIDAGMADVVAPVEELPARIVAYHRHSSLLVRPETVPEERQQSDLDKILILLRARSGNDFSLYKRSTVLRRIERRMGLHQIDRLEGYMRFLRENPRETELLFQELLIGVTSFFRDREAWEILRTEVLPGVLASRLRSGVLRAWVPACSTGEEAYSLAVAITEAMDVARTSRDIGFQIFATDLDQEAIERARQGLYPANIAVDVSPERLRRFFLQEENGYRVRKEIRESLVFAPQNVITDPPFTKLDLLSCRNLLIYLSSELQKKLIPLFHYSLLPGGTLFLGTAETVGTFTDLFGPLHSKTRLYRRLATEVGATPIEFPAAYLARAGAREPEEAQEIKASPKNLQALADRVIASRFAPPVVLVSDKGDILYISSRTGQYLEPAVGKMNVNILAMAREGLRFELSRAFAAALKQEGEVTVRGVHVKTNESTQVVDLRVQRLSEPRELRGTVLVVFSAAAPAPQEPPRPAKSRRISTNTRVAELERELRHAREEAQGTREEMQTSQEELKSTNEELQSTNEELQSTNEELTTSKEEMQSMNEELQTVNRELQSKLDDLARTSNDMRNLLNSTEIATLFLDSELLVRRFTTPITRIIKLIPTDAGRPITDIATDLDYPDLVEDAREVLRSLVYKEKQVSTRDGRWFTVRTMPYRTQENVIDGVVITFTDTTASKELERVLRERSTQLKQMTEALPGLVWGCRPDGAWEFLSPQWVEFTGVGEAEQLGDGWLDQVHKEDRERVRGEWRAALAGGIAFNLEFRLRERGGGFRWFKSSAVPIRDERGVVVRWYGMSTNVHALKTAARRLDSIVDWVSDAFLALDGELTIVGANAAVQEVLGRARAELVGRPVFEVLPETAGTPFEELLRAAGRREEAGTCSVHLAGASHAGDFRALIHGHPEGASILLKRTGEVDRGRTRDGVEGEGS